MDFHTTKVVNGVTEPVPVNIVAGGSGAAGDGFKATGACGVALLAATTGLFSVYNPVASGKVLSVRRVSIWGCFLGVTTPNLCNVTVNRFVAVANYTGGAAQGISRDDVAVNSVAAVRNASAGGLTNPVGVVVDTSLIAAPIVCLANSQQFLNFVFETPVKIDPGSGLVIIVGSAPITGYSIFPSIEWTEA